MNFIYQELYDRSRIAYLTLKEYGIINSSTKGRFIEYRRILSEYRNAHAQYKKEKFIDKYSKDKFAFAFKELLELTDIITALFSIYDSFSDKNKLALRKKVKLTLSGPIFPKHENYKNNNARNFQFELRLATQLIKDGYKDLIFGENPDLSVIINKRCYILECKRIFGKSPRAVRSNIIKAIKQLNRYKNNFFGKIIALDLSPQFVIGHDFVGGTSINALDNFILSELKEYMIYLRYNIPELNKAARDNSLVALILNISAVYVLFGHFGLASTFEGGAIEETSILAFNNENLRANIFGMDFANL